MSKIQETLGLIQAGARSNKYRILYPIFSKDIDIICNASSTPGREVSTVDVFVKGRRYQLAGEMSDDGTWEMTIYNTPDLLHRRFFLKMIGGIHNFQTPDYLLDGGSLPYSDLNGGTNLSVSGSVNTGIGGIAGAFLEDVSGVVSSINNAYNDIRTTFSAVQRTTDNIKRAINGDWESLESLVVSSGYSATPWYQQEIIIQQLDNNDEVIATTTLNNAFVTNVGPLEYNDENGEISTSVITFAYSGIEFGSNTEIPSIENY